MSRIFDVMCDVLHTHTHTHTHTLQFSKHLKINKIVI